MVGSGASADFRVTRIAIAATLVLCAPLAAGAAEQTDGTTTPAVALTNTVPGSSSPGGLPPSTPGTLSLEDCARLNKYNIRSQIVENQPSVCDRVAPALGGVRNSLADYGIGFQALMVGGLNYDILGHEEHPQLYGGQSPTFNATATAFLTYDLSRAGVPGDSQLIVGGVYYGNNYFASERYLGFATVAVNQRFLNNAVELQYGFFPLIHNFYGFILAGNVASNVYGPESNVLVSSGISEIAPTPSAQIIVRDPATHRFYNNFIISRSTSPEGLLADNNANPTGLRLTVPGARALFVDEVGYKRPASQDERSVWIRGGAVINTSQYARLIDPTSPDRENNHALYGAVTYQLTSPYGDARGWYFDAKADFAPSSVNVFSRDYSVTLYSIAPFASRPKDMASLSWSQSFFSSDERARVASFGAPSAHSTASVTLSYSFNVTHGTYLSSSLIHTWNPTFTPLRQPALFINESLVLVF